ncbi:ATP-binding protein [Stakelama saccharophila]|uniref:histidine kinase n=1 Tax=Stakelama saccharophila TaxID=3075605 RepID=A0ABZ0B6M1_9SPHN|nr:ATP-binding protein [Stakelama sp. W311]WNO53023.1 ATP-binding protein [Stakelama sp. W311]
MRFGLLSYGLLTIIASIAGILSVPAVAFPAPRQWEVDRQLDLANRSMLSDPNSALRHAEAAAKSLERYPEVDSRAGKDAESHWLRAEASLRLGRVEDARKLIEKGLAIVRALPASLQLKGKMLLTLGNVQMVSGDAAKALNSFHDAHHYFEISDDARSESLSLTSIATLYFLANDTDRALKYFSEATKVYKGDPSLSMALHNNLGNVYLQTKNYNAAIKEFSSASEYANNINDPGIKTLVLRNLAYTLALSGKLDRADQRIREAMKAERNSERFKSVPAVIVKAEIELERGNLDSAVNFADEAFQRVDTINTSADFRYAHLIAYQVYSEAGNAKKALRHLEAFNRISERSNAVASNMNAALAAARFDYKNQELRIAKLKAEELRRNVEYERSQARSQRILFFSVGGAALLLVGMLTVGLIAIRRSRNETREANSDLAATNIALERALAAKTEFLATTSHEIRTPLNGILGMTQVMLADRGLPVATRERVQVVHGAGQTMRALVDDILDVAKMETGNLAVEMLPMNLRDTLRDVARMWEEQAAARQVDFVLDVDAGPEWIESDPARIRQIVFNLLSNALKFTQAGTIALRAGTVDAEGGPRLHVAVADSGIGIPEDRQSEIFESFKQVDTSTTRKYGGTGLGLSICRSLARALGGDILLESAPGEGATFTVDLPLRRTMAPDSAESRTAERTGGLLLLDRNPISRSMLKTLLEPRTGAVQFASDPADAAAKIAIRKYSCLVIDETAVKMDGGEPFAGLAMLAGVARQHDTVSVILWKAPDAQSVAAIQASGIDHLIEKPIAGAALADRLFGTNAVPPLVSQAA